MELYHATFLQSQAHAAVRAALHAGRLVRQPCEVCGETGQAHHDSYYPDQFLNVRWLCTLHHRQWHCQNEPIWPTIFEFHPSDRPGMAVMIDGQDRVRGKSGRPSCPWFRAARQAWFVKMGGKYHNLGKDYEAAVARFRVLQAESQRKSATAAIERP